MTETLRLVIYMGLVSWVTILAASMIRVKAWTPAGLMLAFGNRDHLPAAEGFAGRLDRTARNTVENFLFFAVIALVTHTAGADGPKVASGAEIFFWARIAYIPVYGAGIVYLRTGVWAVSIIGLGMMLAAIL